MSGPEDPIHLYYSNKCACNLYLNKVREALDDADACTKYQPTWAKGFSRYGGCLERLNRLQEALAAFERAKELDPNNASVTADLNRMQRRLNIGGTGGGFNGFGGMAGGDFMQQAREQMSAIFMKATLWWAGQTQSQRWTYALVAGGLGMYLLSSLFSRRSDYYYDYGYGEYSSYGRGSGMSWLTWGGIILAAYALPPMFPEQLGQYARPFFGMSVFTFMWLLNMFTGGRGGGGGGRRGYRRGFF